MTAAGVEETARTAGANERGPTAGANEGGPTASTGPWAGWHRRRDVWTVVGAVAFAAFAVVLFGRRYTYFDMRIYHGAVEWWIGGGPLYEFIAPGTTLGFTYPPFAALTMLPMATMSAVSAGWVNTVISVAALAAVLAMLLVPMADRYGWPRWPTLGVALPLALALEPSRETLGFGQVNLLLFALVMVDLLALRWRAGTGRPTATGESLAGLVERGRGLVRALARGGTVPAAGPATPADRVPVAERTDRGPVAGGHRPTAVPGRTVAGSTGTEAQPSAGQIPAWAGALARWWFSGAWAGVGIGLATAVKLTPGLFIVYLLVSRQWRPAGTAVVTAAGASLFAWLAAPRESTAYFTDVLWQTDRVGAADFTPNQSLAGLLARLHDVTEAPPLLWLAFAALCGALGLSRAVSSHREGDELTAFTLVGLTATVISPISWTHHLVFVLPAVVVLLDAALRRRAAVRRTGLGWRPFGWQWRVGSRPAAGSGPRGGAGRTGSGLAGLAASAPNLAGLRYGAAALGVYLLFLLSPIWWVRHRLPEGSHYDSGMWGILAENSLALGVILLVALLPWRTGADFPPTRSWN